jgi:pyruvate dehydrogenase E2 component (dihydrolipoamide acetyltransferase)
MSESVNLPALGESVTEGTVTRWLKKVGERVEVDEPLLEVSTDKVDTEIPSPVAGVIEEILVAEDETVEVGTALVRIGDGSGGSDAPPATESAAPEAEPAAAPSAPAAPPTPAAPVETPAPVEEAPVETVKAAAPAAVEASTASNKSTESHNSDADDSQSSYLTPLVRKLANDRGVDLSSITGTGVGGRIRKQDVLDASEKTPSTKASAATDSARVVREISPLRGTTVAMSRLRKVIAERAVISMQSSAQLTSVVEVDVTAVANYRNSVKDKFHEKTGTKLSFLPFFALAAAEALTSNPIINATIEDNSIVYPPQENISIAVDTERGLLTPVIRDAASLDLAGLAGQIADLAQRTRDNKLTPDELSGGTFTLTNTGSRGALFDTPIVFLPQSAILGTGIVTKKPVVVSDANGDSIGIRSMVYLALSYDHRIVDGADAARFLVDVKNRLEGGDFADKLGI